MITEIWHCPECDRLHLMERAKAFIFKDEGGPFIMVYENGKWTTHKFYLIGEL